MVSTIICKVGTIICDIGTINVRFYLLEVRYPHRYCRITLIELMQKSITIIPKRYLGFFLERLL